MSSKLYVNDILGLTKEEIKNTRITLNMVEGKNGKSCLDIWLEEGRVNFGYHNTEKRDDHKLGQYNFAFAQMVDKKDWLLISAGKIITIPGKNINGYCEFEKINDKFESLIGRLIIRIEDKKGDRGRYCYTYEHWMDKAVVKELLIEKYDKSEFPGYDHLNIKMRDLANNMTNRNCSKQWEQALKDIKAVYVINNHAEGKLYIGSAYGDKGRLFDRWKDYIDSKHGHDASLKKLHKQYGDDYFLDNFYFSILESFSINEKDEKIIERESYWKEVFCTRDPKKGYNNN